MTGTDGQPILGARVRQRIGSLFPGEPVSSLEVLPGGHSGLTYRVRAGERLMVVKAVPPGRKSVGRHDVVRQARILRALGGTAVPVPRLVTVDDAEPAWFAMRWVPGQAVEPVLDGVSLPPGLARARAVAATRALVALHRVDVTTLDGHAEPAVTPADEVTKWNTVLHAGPPEFIARGETLAAALARSVPAPVPPAIVHGDYRLGNVLCEGSEVRAIVDWEIWGIGDPRVDLGYFGVFADHRNFPEIGTEVAELPGELELADIYGEAAGRRVADTAWFAALGRFRMAAIMAHNLRRHREGRHHDETQESLPATIHRLTETGLQVLAGLATA